MKGIKLLIVINCLLITGTIHAQNTVVYGIKADRLETIRKRIKNGDSYTIDLKNRIVKQADKLLPEQPGSVMMKSIIPPSGNKHDYMSMAPYFWPDSTKPGGVPYMRKDGERNPETYLISDHKQVDKLVKAVQYCSLAYNLTGDEKYAEKAASFLQTWFIDTATKMNPNLQYAQFIKGVNNGRGAGLIDVRGFADIVNSVGLLKESKSWTNEDNDQLKTWVRTYLAWMLESKNGKAEQKAKNNHGIWYDQQIVAFQLYLNDTAAARKYMNTTLNRIAQQIEPDGKMPAELVRTAALSYNTFCLEAWFRTASFADNAGVDIWHYTTADGRSIRKALDWLLPYAMGEKKWEYKQIHNYTKSNLYYLLLQAASHYNNPAYSTAAQKIKMEAANPLAELYYGE